MEEKSTLTIPKISESNIGGNIENRIQTIWQFMLIILALTYLGKCIHRQWTFRSLLVSITNTPAPTIALNVSNEADCKYEEIQNVEYEDPDRYLSSAPNVNNSQGKVDSGSIRPSPQLLIEGLTEEQKFEKMMYENQSTKGVRETEDLYLSPVNSV